MEIAPGVVHGPGPREWSMNSVYKVVQEPGPWSIRCSINRVHKGGPWTWVHALYTYAFTLSFRPSVLVDLGKTLITPVDGVNLAWSEAVAIDDARVALQ